MNEGLGQLMRGPAVYSAGGILIYGWRRTSIAEGLWPANGETVALQSPQKVVDAAAVFQPQSGAEITVCWNDAIIFDVCQNDFHAFLLARRKMAANSAAHERTDLT